MRLTGGSHVHSWGRAPSDPPGQWSCYCEAVSDLSSIDLAAVKILLATRDDGAGNSLLGALLDRSAVRTFSLAEEEERT